MQLYYFINIICITTILFQSFTFYNNIILLIIIINNNGYNIFFIITCIVNLIYTVFLFAYSYFFAIESYKGILKNIIYISFTFTSNLMFTLFLLIYLPFQTSVLIQIIVCSIICLISIIIQLYCYYIYLIDKHDSGLITVI